MEFPSIGSRCYFEGCLQLDFLPFRCSSCEKHYCLDHRYPTSHQCLRWGENEKNVQLCDTCSSMILKPEGKSAEYTLNEHLRSNCALHLLSSTPITGKRCFSPECKNTSEGGVLVYVVCDGCGEIFCLKHRHPPTHQCESLNIAFNEKAKRRMKAEEIISKYKKKSNTTSSTDDKSSSSSKSTTNKPKKGNKMIEVMKLKSKAQGDSSIPANSRIYLSVDFPRDSKASNKPMFFNKEWTIGKVLDKIATTGNISNNNNRIPKGDPDRLVLVNNDTENILETDKRLSDVVENGGNISLEKYALIKK